MLKKQALIKTAIESYYKIQEGLEDLKVLAELEASQEELDKQISLVEKWIEAEELRSTLSGEGDNLGLC